MGHNSHNDHITNDKIKNAKTPAAGDTVSTVKAVSTTLNSGQGILIY